MELTSIFVWTMESVIGTIFFSLIILGIIFFQFVRLYEWIKRKFKQ